MKENILQDYQDMPGVYECVVVNGIGLVAFDACVTGQAMPVDLSLIAQSNIKVLKEKGASQLDIAVNKLSDLKPEDIAGSASVFICDNGIAGQMAVMRLDMEDSLSAMYKGIQTYSSLDEKTYSEMADDVIEDNKREICDTVIAMFREQHEEMAYTIEEADLDFHDIIDDNEDIWNEIKHSVGWESNGWFIENEARAINAVKSVCENAQLNHPMLESRGF